MSSYWRSVVTMAVSCIISDLKQDTGQKSLLFHTPPVFDAPSGGPRQNIAIMLVQKTRMMVLPDGKKFANTFTRLIQHMNVSHGRTDATRRQVALCIASRGKNYLDHLYRRIAWMSIVTESSLLIVVNISTYSSAESVVAQTEGDTGYDYNEFYDEDYEEESGMQIHEINAVKLFG